MPNRVALLLLLGVGLLGASGSAPRIESFSPEGLAKGVRQVAVRFSQPMVALGDPRPPLELFAIACAGAEPGVARWVDERSWVYDFAQDLPAGIACRFTLRAEARALSGARLAGRREFRFSTGGPAVQTVRPWPGGQVGEDQRFVLRLDAPAEPRSVEAYAHFRVEGLTDPLGVRVIGGAERDLALRRNLRDPKPSDLVLEARQRFPAGRRLELVWERGVATASGIATHEAQRFEFRVREPLVLRSSCPRENARADCLPLGALELLFSAPVAAETARRIRLVPLAGGTPLAPEPAYEFDSGDFVSSWKIRGPFAPEARYRLELPADLRDDAGRPLEPPDPQALEIRVAKLPPLAKFATRFGVIEAEAPALPVTLRRIEPEALPEGASIDLAGAAAGLDSPSAEQVLAWLRAASPSEWSAREQSLFARVPAAQLPAERRSFALPPPASPDASEVIGIPLPGLGLHAVEIASRALGLSHLGADRPMYASAVALVTNLSVHFKWGREGSLAWITSLDRGRPVAGADVAVFDCAAKRLASGTSDGDGIVRLGGLPAPDASPDCEGYGRYDTGLLVMAQLARDVSFVHTSWEDGIELFRFAVPTRWEPAPLIAHTLLDRALFRAGETVHMKHLVRRPVLAGFAEAEEAALPDAVRIQHLGSETPVELPLELAADGSALSEWAIPKDAKLGVYEIALLHVPPGPDEPPVLFSSGRFRVEEFRLPLLTGALQPPAEPLVDRREFPLDVALRYLAGGPARGLETTLRTQLRPRGVRVEDYEEFAFLSGALREGIERRSWEGAEEPEAAAPEVRTQKLVLDEAGGARATLGELPASEGPTELVAELAFRDPNGETQTLSRTLPLWPAAHLIGLRVSRDFAKDEPLRAEAIVLDLAERPVRRAPVEVEVFERKTWSHRKRLVGGFYAYEHVTETRRVGTLCEGRTDARGRFACEAKAKASGELVLRATTRDDAGRVAATHVERWLPGEEDWYAADASDRMDLLPDRRRYEPGEVAFVHVRMPFREATALVTVEREGVAEAFVKPLSGREPWVAVPIRGSFAPNVFVSVLAVRGRLDAPKPTARVDLARPAMRLGMTKLRVGWRAHELRVSVASERDVYRVRETAKLRVRVRTPDGDFPPPGSEIAVAAVDEGLLELAPNPSWQLLEAMEDERAQEVRTSTAQLQVVGKRHYGQKAVPSGGGGGGRPTRELFDTLLAWQPRVPLDGRGEARLEIPLNDSLTRFRIVALATAGMDRFGTGSASVRSTQELMVLAGVPPLAREGDRLRPEFTLRNTTEADLAVTAALRVEGLGREIAPEPLELGLVPQRVVLGPGEARAVGFALEVPPGARELAYQLDATSEGGGPADRIRVVQRVLPAVPEQVVQATLLQLDRPARLPVQKPADALPGRGALEVALRPTLANGTQGIEQFFRAYPYHCLEQRVSRAIGLRDDALWQGLAAELPAHLDRDGLAKFFPAMRDGSDVLTSYVLATAHEAGWELPAASRQRMLDALEAFVDGRIQRGRWAPMNDLPLRKLAALEALARHGRDVTARLAALPRQPELWPTSALLDGMSLLRRLPTDAARSRELARIERLLRARLTLGGPTLGFSTEAADGMDWLLATAELNLVRFVGLAHQSPAFRSDVPRLVEGALGRQRRGAWSTTLANAWGRLALERFSRAFEQAKVAGETQVALAGEARSVAWAGGVPAPLRLPWPLGPGEVALRHQGAGAPWAELRSVAAIPLERPLFAGYTVARRWTPLEQKTPGILRRGDLVRVHLDVDAQSDAAWVVISDPIPTGASVLGSGLGRDSALATEGQRTEGDGWWCPCRAFTERSFEAYRDYFEYVPKGRLAIEYTLRLDQDGRFGLPPTRVEAMYAPESFAELPHDPIEVAP
jgi:uncharacterized protein YfaS (alpha-2-macroglobulin family)